MTLYDLYLLPTPDGRIFLGEVSGVAVGMNGFSRVYGDNRVEDQVIRMLTKRYGRIAFNNGTSGLKK